MAGMHPKMSGTLDNISVSNFIDHFGLLIYLGAGPVTPTGPVLFLGGVIIVFLFLKIFFIIFSYKPYLNCF